MREEFTALGATTRVISSTDHIFHKDFRNLLQTIQIFCAKGKKKNLNVELIFDKYFRLFGLNALFQKGMSNKLVCSLLGWSTLDRPKEARRITGKNVLRDNIKEKSK